MKPVLVYRKKRPLPANKVCVSEKRTETGEMSRRGRKVVGFFACGLFCIKSVSKAGANMRTEDYNFGCSERTLKRQGT